MAITLSISRQAQNVLVNLERVIDKPYVLAIRSPQRRSQLDGIECTTQITSLVNRGLVREDARGKLSLTSAGKRARLEHKTLGV